MMSSTNKTVSPSLNVPSINLFIPYRFASLRTMSIGFPVSCDSILVNTIPPYGTPHMRLNDKFNVFNLSLNSETILDTILDNLPLP